MTQLAPDERVAWEGTLAWLEFPYRWLGGGFLLLVGVALFFVPRAKGWAPIVILASPLFPLTIWVNRAARRYTVTSQRAIARRGLLSRVTTEIELKHIRDVQLRQSVFQRLFRIGTLSLSSAGGAGAEVVFEGISDPEGVKELVRQQLRVSG